MFVSAIYHPSGRGGNFFFKYSEQNGFQLIAEDRLQDQYL